MLYTISYFYLIGDRKREGESEWERQREREREREWERDREWERERIFFILPMLENGFADIIIINYCS